MTPIALALLRAEARLLADLAALELRLDTDPAARLEYCAVVRALVALGA